MTPLATPVAEDGRHRCRRPQHIDEQIVELGQKARQRPAPVRRRQAVRPVGGEATTRFAFRHAGALGLQGIQNFAGSACQAPPRTGVRRSFTFLSSLAPAVGAAYGTTSTSQAA